jgi:adenylate kinase family enzyme
VPPELPLGSRIVIAGPAASGKSTVARQLAAVLSLPVVELDALYWKPDWVASSEDEFREKVADATAGEAWIVDGHYERVWPELWPRAQAVIWLDLPLPILLVRGFARSWRRWRGHEELWGTNRESVWRQLKFWDADRSLLGWLLRSHKARRRSYIAATVDPRWEHIRFVRICADNEIAQLLVICDIASSRVTNSHV